MIDDYVHIRRLNMYKVELCFDTDKLDLNEAERMCSRTDAIFKQKDLSCSEKSPGKRVYLDQGRKQDYGRFWAAIFALKDASELVSNLKECFWYNGSAKENLMTDFLRN